LLLKLFTAGTPVRASGQHANNRPTGRQDCATRLSSIIARGNTCRYNDRFAAWESELHERDDLPQSKMLKIV
jgi:hypothetical protein